MFWVRLVGMPRLRHSCKLLATSHGIDLFLLQLRCGNSKCRISFQFEQQGMICASISHMSKAT